MDPLGQASVLRTVRELHDHVSGTGVEWWVLSAPDYQGSTQHSPLCVCKGRVVLGLTADLVRQLQAHYSHHRDGLEPPLMMQGITHDSLLPPGTYSLCEAGDGGLDRVLVGLATETPNAQLTVWDPVQQRAIPTVCTVHGRSVRFIIPTEVLRSIERAVHL